MTMKIKLTQEVADAIERLRNADFTDYGIVVHVGSDGPSNHSSGEPTERRIIRNWTFGDDGANADKLLDALRNGYEVEPQFEEGDWVATIHNEAPIICKVKRVQQTVVDSDYLMGSNGCERIFNISEIRHATPEEIAQEKERRLWKPIGRGVGEFKDGDIGVLRNGQKFSHLNNLKNYRDDLVGFYPIESFVSFGGDEE